MIEVKKIVGGPIDTNTYIVRCGEEVVIFDPEASVEKIKKEVGNSKVCGVILTHGHFDHMTHMDDVLNEYNTKCYLSKHALPKLFDPIKNCSAWLGLNIKVTSDPSCFVAVKDGQVLKLFDEKITILETPGHSDCCICAIIGNVMFTGDTVFHRCLGRVDVPTSSREAMEKSAERLNREYSGMKIYPAHSKEGTICGQKLE